MSSTNPWSLTVVKNIFEGWDETKCISCTVENPALTFKFDNLRIKQFMKWATSHCGWKKVRHSPIGPQWHLANDELK